MRPELRGFKSFIFLVAGLLGHKLFIALPGQVIHPQPWLILGGVAIATKVSIQSWTSASSPGSLGPPHNYTSVCPFVYPRLGEDAWIADRNAPRRQIRLHSGVLRSSFLIFSDRQVEHGVTKRKASVNKLSDGACKHSLAPAKLQQSRLLWLVAATSRGKTCHILASSSLFPQQTTWVAPALQPRRFQTPNKRRSLWAPCCGTPAPSNGQERKCRRIFRNSESSLLKLPCLLN